MFFNILILVKVIKVFLRFVNVMIRCDLLLGFFFKVVNVFLQYGLLIWYGYDFDKKN